MNELPGVVSGLGFTTTVAAAAAEIIDAAGLYALRRDPPRGRVLLPPR